MSIEIFKDEIIEEIVEEIIEEFPNLLLEEISETINDHLEESLNCCYLIGTKECEEVIKEIGINETIKYCNENNIEITNVEEILNAIYCRVYEENTEAIAEKLEQEVTELRESEIDKYL